MYINTHAIMQASRVGRNKDGCDRWLQFRVILELECPWNSSTAGIPTRRPHILKPWLSVAAIPPRQASPSPFQAGKENLQREVNQ